MLREEKTRITDALLSARRAMDALISIEQLNDDQLMAINAAIDAKLPAKTEDGFDMVSRLFNEEGYLLEPIFKEAFASEVERRIAWPHRRYGKEKTLATAAFLLIEELNVILARLSVEQLRDDQVMAINAAIDAKLPAKTEDGFDKVSHLFDGEGYPIHPVFGFIFALETDRRITRC